MKLGAILPHTMLYGGVKRFFELGNVFIGLGHEFLVFTPDGVSPAWYNGKVQTFPLDKLQNHDFQAVFITEMQFLAPLLSSRAKHKVFYFVRATDNVLGLKKHPEVQLFANSTSGYEVLVSKWKRTPFKAFGGINVHSFWPKPFQAKENGEPFVIMVYGRLLEKRKGTMLVVRACERLQRKGYRVRLLLFDTPVNEKSVKAIENFKSKVPFEFVVNHPVEKNVELYHRADIFVAAERKTGTSNTAAEAMASGVPVIGTTSGTKDFLIHGETGLVVSRWSWRISSAIEKLLNDAEMRKRFASNGRRKIEEFSWESLAQRIHDRIKD